MVSTVGISTCLRLRELFELQRVGRFHAKMLRVHINNFAKKSLGEMERRFVGMLRKL